jgi:hypothetical protein
VKRAPASRALTFLGSTLLVLAVFEACSNDDSSTSTVAGPPSISITKLSFGSATVSAADGAPACSNPLGVALNIGNWTLKEPGACASTPQCGQVRVTLLKSSDSTALATKVAVGAGVDLNLATPLEAGSYTIEAELIDDSGAVFTITDAGSSSAQKSFTLNPPVDCSSGAGSGATSGDAGAAGASSSEAGASGFGGAPPDLGTAGSDGIVAGAGGA